MVALARWLAARPEVDSARVGLAGASQAGWIIPLAAEREPRLRFGVVISGPAVTVGREIAYSELAGEDPGSRKGLGDEEIARIMARFDGPEGYDPIPVLERTRLPMIWIQGEKDRSLPMAETLAALERLRQISSRVVSEQASGQDVSADYVDLQTRLTNLEATSARVREFLAEAKTVEESLKVNGELSRLEGEIAQIKGQMKYYEGRAAFSTIGIALTQVSAAPTPEPTAAWDPGKALTRATDNAGRMSQGLYDAFVYVFIGFAPLWAPGLAIVFGLVWLGRRGTRQKSVERKA